MDVFIKSFNRPFLLDKCLASIRMFAKNFNGNIVVMDDGTPQLYLNKISEKFPEIRIVKSDSYIVKSHAIENDLFPQRTIPAVFWKETISQGTDFFVLIEDDCWFCEPIDFFELEKQMRKNHLQLVKFLWMGNDDLISNQIAKRTESLVITKPKLFSWNPFVFELIYRKKTCKIDSILNRLGVPIENNLLKYYQIYAVANAAFSKKYYLKAWKTTTNKVDELAQIKEVIQIPKSELNVAHSISESIRTSLKTTASSQNKENLNSDFNVYSLNKILNEVWLINEFEAFDFQKDISNDFIENVITNANLPSNTVGLWLNWYNKLKQQYIDIGCKFSNDR